MRILFGLTALAMACGSAPKHESAVVNEGSDVPSTCCCKTIPATAEKEIIPNYAMVGRMECGAQHGDCVDDVQCNATPQQQPSETTAPANDGTPPPPPVNPGGGGDPAVP